MAQVAYKTERSKRWFCICVTPDGDKVTLVARAGSVQEASQTIHRAERGYDVDYIEDILTPQQMEMRKTHLGKDYYSTAPLS